MSQHSHKYYKFALFGRTNSGKTCYLTALALGNFGSATEMTCVRMPVIAKGKTSATESVEDTDFEALKRGEQLIDDALKSLNKGYPPDATPLNVLKDQDLPAIEYKLSTAEKSSILIRTVDYPGELVDPAALKSSDALATTLKGILSKFDGLLIITGLPEKDEDSKQTSEILELKASFSALAESKDKDLDQTPVAIAITKWDRSPSFNPKAKATDAQEIETFLENHPAVDSLFKTIVFALGDQSSEKVDEERTGYYKGNSAFFVTSAFGNNRPQINGMSYGVLDPLLWLVHRRDFLDTQYLENQWETNKLSKWSPKKSRDCVRNTSKILQRVSKRSESYRRLNHIRSEAAKKFVISVFSVTVSFLLICNIGFGEYLKGSLKTIGSEIQNPSTNLDKLVELKEELNWIDNSKKYTLIKKRLNTEINEYRTLVNDKYEDIYYKPFEKATNDVEKYDVAVVYVEKLPNGKEYIKCKDFIQQHEITTNDKWMSQSENKASLVLKENDEQKITLLLEEIKRGTSLRQMTSDIVKRLDELKVKLGDALVRISALKEWNPFYTSFDTALKNGDYKQTANLLINRSPKDGRWKDLVKQFPDLVEKSVASKIEATLKLDEYDDSLKIISTSLESLKSIELNVRSYEPMLADVQMAGQQKLQKIKKVVDQKYDAYLYSIVQKNRNTYSCENYNKKSPTKRMANAVDSYMKYLSSLTEERTVSCQVRIKWHEDYDYGDDNRLKIWVNDNVRFEPMATIPCKRGDVSDILGSFEVRIQTLEESFKINATIVEEDFPDYNDNGGKGTRSVKANEMLRNDVSIPLNIDNTNIVNELLLRIDSTSIPQEPELPEYES